MLFIVFINDATAHLPSSVFAGLYADDLKLFARASDYADLQKAVNTISEWATQWNMQLSIPKCSVVHYGPQRHNTIFTLSGNALSVNEVVRDLGVHMSCKLTFDEHIKVIVSKAMARANNILRCFKSRSIILLTKSFVTYVRPLLESAPEIWNPTTAGLVRDVEYVQRNFTRRIIARAGLPQLPYSVRLQLLSLDSLEYRRACRDLIFIHKCLHGFVKFDLSCFIRVAPLNRHVRNVHNLRLELPYNIPGTKRSSCLSRCIAVWNALPAVLVNARTSESFSSGLLNLPKNTIVPVSFVCD